MLAAVLTVFVGMFVLRALAAVPLGWVLMLTAGGVFHELHWGWVRPISFWLALGIAYVLSALVPAHHEAKAEKD